MKKKILATVLAAMVAFSVPMSASAAWRKDSVGNWQWWENGKKQIGWKYIYQSGYNTNGYFTTMGEYYFNSSGNMVTGWQFISNKWYYFGADGKALTGVRKLNKKYYYYNNLKLYFYNHFYFLFHILMHHILFLFYPNYCRDP